MSGACIDHLAFVGASCEDCGLAVDQYGNTENQFDYCAFPDCGCDGNRLCMATNGASARAFDSNVEGMWGLKTPEAKRAVGKLLGAVYEDAAAKARSS